MTTVSRKEFLKTSALVLATLSADSAIFFRKTNPLLSFSTLGCPDWTFQQITSFAAQHGYKGIEVRGLQRQLDLTKCPEFSTEDSVKKTLALMKEKGLQFVGLGSSANLYLTRSGWDRKSLPFDYSD